MGARATCCASTSSSSSANVGRDEVAGACADGPSAASTTWSVSWNDALTSFKSSRAASASARASCLAMGAFPDVADDHYDDDDEWHITCMFREREKKLKKQGISKTEAKKAAAMLGFKLRNL